MPKLWWFMYDQNNSGGVFIRNDRVGDCLFIQAYDVEEADRIMDKATAQDDWWCECCGPRWRGDIEGPKITLMSLICMVCLSKTRLLFFITMMVQ